MGVSRSSAAVLAYLMLRQKMTASEALIEVKLQFILNISISVFVFRWKNTDMFDQMLDFFVS